MIIIIMIYQLISSINVMSCDIAIQLYGLFSNDT